MIKKYYHGTNMVSAKDILEKGINLQSGRQDADFGQGFYTTESYEQAKRWAGKTKSSAVIGFYCDTDKLDGVKFNGFTKEWKEYVYNNRVDVLDTCPFKDYIEGPLADGRTKRMARKVSLGEISKADFMAEISKSDIGSQVAFKTQKAVDSLKMGHIVKEDDNK